MQLFACNWKFPACSLETRIGGGVKSPLIRGGVKILNFRGS